jgi:hypothetical protein
VKNVKIGSTRSPSLSQGSTQSKPETGADKFSYDDFENGEGENRCTCVIAAQVDSNCEEAKGTTRGHSSKGRTRTHLFFPTFSPSV